MSLLILWFLVKSPALAQPGRYSDWHMGRLMMGDWGVGWFGMIFMIIFWGLIIVGLVLLIRLLIQNASGKAHSGVSTGSKAMDILKERYARGEINLDEFESMKKDIIP
jgi:putative membrane protein